LLAGCIKTLKPFSFLPLYQFYFCLVSLSLELKAFILFLQGILVIAAVIIALVVVGFVFGLLDQLLMLEVPPK